jgi:nucleoside 2-deoxyribosyltransferase
MTTSERADTVHLAGRQPYSADPVVGEGSLAVLMPFRVDFDRVYERIRAAGTARGLTVRRADEVFTTSEVAEHVYALIRSARLLVADCTGRNPNVFYEIGYAHAIGKPVVLITSAPNDITIDVRGRMYVRYLDTVAGLAELERALGAALADVLAKPAP